MQENLKYYNHILPIAISVVLSLGIFMYLGVWLDNKYYGKTGIFTVAGIVMGLISAGYNSWRFVHKLLKDMEKEDADRKKSS